jgi:hypothetical protein
MDDKAAVLVDVCAALSSNQLERAAAILHERYPFVPLVKVGRRYSIGQMLRVFVREALLTATQVRAWSAHPRFG